MHKLTGEWLTEVVEQTGTAFSMRLGEKLHEEQTPYQAIAIYHTDTFGNAMLIDDCLMLTERDNFIYHEMMSHPPLFTHPAPRRVLIIGGGDCGTLREVLRHPGVERVTQVDIDERVTRLSERYFPELCESNGDPRAELSFADGIRWVDEAAPGSLDLIIVDSTDPVGPAEGLFREPFFRSCRRALAADGIIVQQSESPLLHLPLIQAMHQTMRAAGFGQTRSYQFPLCSYPSGWWSATMAGAAGALDVFRERDAADRGFVTRYYDAGIHRGALAMPVFFSQAVQG